MLYRAASCGSEDCRLDECAQKRLVSLIAVLFIMRSLSSFLAKTVWITYNGGVRGGERIYSTVTVPFTACPPPWLRTDFHRLLPVTLPLNVVSLSELMVAA